VLRRLHATLVNSDAVSTITFTDGRLRDEADMVAKELRGLTDGLSGRHLFLDFVNVRYITGDELGTLLNLQRKMRAGGGRLTLSNLTPAIHELFVVTKLNTILEIRLKEPPIGAPPPR
jgi:anti-anti-sigma factor